MPFFTQVMAQDDHPLISRYQGSLLTDKREAEFESYRLIVGRSERGEFIAKNLEGKVTRIVYKNPSERSTLEIYRNYQSALENLNYEPIYACELDECGPAYGRSAWNRFNGLFVAADGDPRYLSGRVNIASGSVYLAIMIGRNRSQLDIIELVEMETDQVIIDAESLARTIDRDGKASLYGIYFDKDMAIVKPESKATLDEIARLLEIRPDLYLFVVGHTDIAGSLRRNQTLSEMRARAVVKVLVDRYAIAATRLSGHGVGPLAPATTNNGEDGRSKNRRVELVAR